MITVKNISSDESAQLLHISRHNWIVAFTKRHTIYMATYTKRYLKCKPIFASSQIRSRRLKKKSGTQVKHSTVNDRVIIVDTIVGSPVLGASKNFMNANRKESQNYRKTKIDICFFFVFSVDGRNKISKCGVAVISNLTVCLTSLERKLS